MSVRRDDGSALLAIYAAVMVAAIVMSGLSMSWWGRAGWFAVFVAAAILFFWDRQIFAILVRVRRYLS